MASTLLATQIAPPPLTMLPGSPPTGIRSTRSPVVALICETFCPSGSATHTEPYPVVTAPGAPFSTVALVTPPEDVSTETILLAPPRMVPG